MNSLRKRGHGRRNARRVPGAQAPTAGAKNEGGGGKPTVSDKLGEAEEGEIYCFKN